MNKTYTPFIFKFVFVTDLISSLYSDTMLDAVITYLRSFITTKTFLTVLVTCRKEGTIVEQTDEMFLFNDTDIEEFKEDLRSKVKRSLTNGNANNFCIKFKINNR